MRNISDGFSDLIDKEKVVAGGNYNEETLQIEPTVLDNVTFEDAVMQEEIFPAPFFRSLPMIQSMKQSKKSIPWHIRWQFMYLLPGEDLQTK